MPKRELSLKVSSNPPILFFFDIFFMIKRTMDLKKLCYDHDILCPTLQLTHKPLILHTPNKTSYYSYIVYLIFYYDIKKISFSLFLL